MPTDQEAIVLAAESELDLEDVFTPQSLVDYAERSGYRARLMGDKLCVWTDGEDHECCGDTLFDPSFPVDLGASNGGIVFLPQTCQICGRDQDLSHAAVIDDDTAPSMRREVDAVLDSWEEIDEHRNPQRSTDAY